MRLVLFPLLPLFLISCQGGIEGSLDGRKYLSTLDGPKVPSVNDSINQNARNAEAAGDFKAAALIYQQLLEKDPENATYLVGMAEALRRSSEFDRALAIYNQALSKNPNNLDAKEGKGLAEMGKGDFDTAGQTLSHVMKAADGTRWRTLNALGILFANKNMFDEAKQYFNAALARSPGNPSIMNNLGLAQALNRDFNQSISTLTEASEHTQKNAAQRKQIDLNLALVYGVSGQLDAAETIAKQHFNGPALKNNMGLYAHLAKDDALAKTYLNMALTESKTYYERAWQNLDTLSGTSTKSGPINTTQGKRIKVPAHSNSTISIPPATPPNNKIVSPTSNNTPSPKATMTDNASLLEKEAATTPALPVESKTDTTSQMLGTPTPPPAAGFTQVPPEARSILRKTSENDASLPMPTTGNSASSIAPPTPNNDESKPANNGFESLGSWFKNAF